MPSAPIVVLFALPEESGEFRALLAERTVTGKGVELVVRGTLDGKAVVVAHTGVGAVRAARRTAEVIQAETPAAVVSAGFAGGLDPEATLGRVVVDARGGGVVVPPGCLAGAIHSAEAVVEQAQAKAALGRESGALAVDMETAAIAGAASAARVRMVAARAISDPVDVDMPVPMEVWFDRERQRPRVFSLLAYLARNPARIGAFARFVRGLKPARVALARALREIVRDVA
jgi:adenosylhomocysteine nucleosidase